MEVEEFERWLRSRDRVDLEWMIHAVDAAVDTADGAVDRLRASREVARVLRRTGRHRLACETSHRIRLSALERCTETGVRAIDPGGSARLARAAGAAAEGLVAGTTRPCARLLLQPFQGVTLLAG